MRSGTSYFNGTVFKKTVTRFWPLWAVYFLIWFITLPLNGLMQVSAQARSTIKDIGYIIRFAGSTVPNMAQSALWLAVVFGLLAAMAVLSHLYGARSANFFAALPVRREGLFLTQYLAGLAFLLVPNAAIALLTLLVEAMGGWVNLPALMYWLGMSSGTCFFFYSMAVFCGMFTGHILALPVFYGVFNVMGGGLWALGTAILRNFYYGYTSGTGRGYAVARWCTPVWNLEQNIWAYFRSPSLVYDAPASAPVGAEITEVLELEGTFEVGMYALAAVVLTVCAFLLYRARRMESAGDVVSVKPMKPVFKYGVAACSGLFLGQATAGVMYMHEPGLMISMVAWAVAGYFVAQMLLDKSFRVFKKWKGALAVAGVFAALFLVVGFDLTGYETRMPSAEQVECVHVYGLEAVDLGDSGDYMVETLTDPKQIELVMDLHRAAISQRDGHGSNSGRARGVGMDLTYYLKDGSTLSRYYSFWVDPGEVGQEGSGAWAMQQLYNDRELFWKVYGFADMDQAMAEEGWWMEQARYSDYRDKYSYSDEYYYYSDPQDADRYFYGKDAQALYEAVREDYQAGRIGVRDLSTVGDEAYTSRGERIIRFTLVNGKGSDSAAAIAVRDTATSTIAAMEALAGDAP